MFWRSFLCAQSIKILFDQTIWHRLQISFRFHFFNFVRKKNENLPLIIGHFITISGQFSANYNRIFHQTEVQTVILRCFVYLYLNWIKCNDIILVKIFFFHAWKCIISGVFHRSKFWHLCGKPAIIFSKWLFFKKSLMISWAT